METRTLLKQTIRKSCSSPLEVATQYYTLLFSLMDLHLPPRELQLMAFTATRGSISSGGAKQQFIDLFKTSKGTVGNLISSLMNQGLLVKEGKAIKVRQDLRKNFSNMACFKLDISIVKQEENVSEGN